MPSWHDPSMTGTDAYNEAAEASQATSLAQPTVINRFAMIQNIPGVPEAPITQSQRARLAKPVAIPAIGSKLGSPFLRAYAPILESHSISKAEFLYFIDNFNRVTVASPPLQVLGLAGNIVSFIPIPPARLVGNAVALGSTVATRVVSKGRAELELSKANKELFGPRGLRVQLCKLDALARLAHMPILDKNGTLDKHAAVLQPLDTTQLDEGESAQVRRLRALQPWIERLEITTLPQVHVPDSPLSKISAGASERMKKHGEAKAWKGRANAEEDHRKEVGKIEEDYQKNLARVEKKESKHGNTAELEQKREEASLEYRGKLDEAQHEGVKNDKEEKILRKILWLVIDSVDLNHEAEESFPTADHHVAEDSE